MSLEQLDQRKIVITCGTGGVGKTTLSAALAIRAALLGKRTLVITIDPAKRLATALGLKNLRDEEMDLTPLLKSYASESGADPIKGTLSAIMPDTRKTFESLVREIAPNPGLAEQVLRNPIFQIFAKEFSGTNEYMALQKLYTLTRKRSYDLIVLDTPPSQNTLAFLDSPKLLARFFEERMIRWLLVPTNKLVSIGMKKALGLLENLTGASFMTNLVEFASALFEVQIQFTANLKTVTSLLSSQEVGFLLVTTALPSTGAEVNRFLSTLNEHQFHFDGVALNRTLGYLKLKNEADWDKAEFSRALQLIGVLQKKEEQAIARLKEVHIPVLARLPELARDIHSLEDLIHVAGFFDRDFYDSAERSG